MQRVRRGNFERKWKYLSVVNEVGRQGVFGPRNHLELCFVQETVQVIIVKWFVDRKNVFLLFKAETSACCAIRWEQKRYAVLH